MPVPTNMATTTTTATTTVQLSVQSAPTGTTTSSITTADQRVCDRLRTAMRRSGNPSRGGPPGGGPPGGGAPGGRGAGPVPAAAAQGPVPVAAPGDIRTMGMLPQIFTGDRAKAQDFPDEVLGYFRANRGVAGFESPMHKVSITLTMIKGSEVAGWARNMGRWIDTLNPAIDDIEFVWEQFQAEFTEQFTNSQQQQCVHLDLDSCHMKFPEIDQYIAKFKDLACLAGYTVGNEETINFFLKGLSQSVLEDVMKPPFATTYNDIKDRAIQMTKAKQLIEGIHARRNYPSTQTFQNMFRTQQQRPHFFNHRNQYQQRQTPPAPQYNSSNALRSLNNQPVPMDVSHTQFPQQHFQANVAGYNQQYSDEETQVAQTSIPPRRPKGLCFNCGIMGHFATDCRRCKETHVNYMDFQDPELNRVPEPTIQPQANIAQLKAQLDALNKQENDALIGLMGGGQSQDFPKA